MKLAQLFQSGCTSLVLVLLTLVALPAYAQSSTAAETSPGVFSNLKFRSLGPAVAGGRVASVVGIPGNPKIYYVGAAGGGVWKSTDGGHTWKAIFNKQPTGSISDVVLDPSNPGIVWVATGEVNIRNDVLDGAGLYRSTDGGKTWQLMGFKDAGNISKVVVDPHNGNIVWVAVFGDVWGPNAERGVFKTTDGGKTWKKVLFVDDNTGAIDLTMDGDNPKVLFAGMWQAKRVPWKLDDGGPGSGIWRSTDGGDTWTKLTNGIPKGPLGRIGLAVAPSNPDRVYALIESHHGVLFESDDLGDHWNEVSDNRMLAGRAFYFSHVFVAPNDENKLYFTAGQLVESDDGGRTAHVLDRGVHPDHHTFWQDPDNPARMIQGNDGGVYLSLDSGAHWRFLDTLPIEQFYQVAASSGWPYMVCGGLQDNNGWCGPSTPRANVGGVFKVSQWFPVVGGDGQYVVPAPSNPDIIYADAQNASMARYNLKTGDHVGITPYHGRRTQETKDLKYRFNWTSPIAVSPADANTVYLGANVVFKTTDGGQHWSVISPDLTRNDQSKQLPTGGPVNLDRTGAEIYDTLLSVVLAPTNANVIWAGSDDGLVHVTQDGGQHWSNVTPPGAPKWERVYQIGVSPFNAGTAYVAFDGHEVSDRKPHVYMTDNYGQSWHSIAAGLPDEPVIVVREDPNQKGFLVLGNMTGLWFSRDNGAHWQEFHSGFPTAPVFDLKFVRHDLVVATHGRGLFVLDNLRPFEEMSSQVAKQNFHLFTPSAGIQYTSAGRSTPRPVMIDYYLKDAIKDAIKVTSEEQKQHHTPVKLVITDSSGQTLATEYGPAKAGVNEYTWTMHYLGPTQLDFVQRSFFGGGRRPMGPPVLPGTYHVAVTADGQTQTTTVTVRGDPNVSVPMEVLRANLKFALQAQNNESAFNEMLNRITAMQNTLTNTQHAANVSAELAARAQALNKQLTALKDGVYKSGFGGSSMPRLNSDVSGFGNPFGSLVAFGRNETVPPTPQVLESANTVWGEVNDALTKFNALLAGDVTAYNKAAFAAGAPTLMVGTPISVKPVQM